MNHTVTLALVLSFCTLLPAVGQTPPAPTAPPAQNPQNPPSADDKDDVVRITTNLVQVDAVVTKDGRPVKDLKAEDFEIYEDGRKQTITTFAYISNLGGSPAPATAPAKNTGGVVPAPPIKRDASRRTLAFVVDDLGLSFESIAQVRRQLRKFVAEQLEPNDLVAVIRTGGEMGALQQFTNDKRLLSRAVEQIRWNQCSRRKINVIPRVGGLVFRGDNRDDCGGYSYLNTMKSLRFILDAMAQLPGRKSMILMSDSTPLEDQEPRLEGVDDAKLGSPFATNYTAYLRKLAEKAIRSSVVIYSVDTQGLQYTGLTAADSMAGTAGRDVVWNQNALMATRSSFLINQREGGDMIARQTGGFQIRNSNDFGFPRIVEDQSGYYLIGYRPTDETFNKKFHHIKAKVKRSGTTVRTRFGFFGVSEEEVERTKYTPTDLANLALASPFGAQDIELDMTSFFADDKTNGSVVRSFVNVDPRNFTFKPVQDKYETTVDMHGVIFGDNGRVVQQVKQSSTLTFPEDAYQRAMRDGLQLRIDMPAKMPGSYQVRIAVRDTATMKLGAAGQFVSVPDLRRPRLAASGIVLRRVAGAAPDSAVMASPVVRRFTPNSEVYFALMLYNATIDPATQSPNVAMEVKLFRNEKVVTSMPETPINFVNQTDLARLFTSGVIKLGGDFEPGNYYLQVVITDKAAKEKQQPPVVQWVDFEIVK
jgi:VWFA-related protein